MMESRRQSAMQERVDELELALQQVAAAKKQLYRNTTEAKSRIQSSISRQLEMLRNREVWLHNQLDLVSNAKEEVLQQQSARLHKTLGVLQTGLAFPGDTSALEIIDSEELRPDETPYISFKADNTQLRNAIQSYGRIDCNDVAPLKSPFAIPGQLAPSLPSHFEDYDDAEHHVLYKTLEEINRGHSDQPCVNVTIPRLHMSNRIEDWLSKPAPAASTAPSNTAPRFSFPKLSNKLSDWVRCPSASAQDGSQPDSGREPLMRETADASITTWLHKIKQNPHEEEEDDFEFIEEVSGTQSSGETLEAFPEPVSYPNSVEQWLFKSSTLSSSQTCDNPPVFMVKKLPLNKWLRQDTDNQKPTSTEPCQIDMSRYFTKITDELDKWLAIDYTAERCTPSMQGEDTSRPTTLKLEEDVCPMTTMSHNPWLLNTFSVSRASSCSSSVCSRKSQKSPGVNKWLLPSQQDCPDEGAVLCPFMEKYKAKMKSACWLKEAGHGIEHPSTNTGTLFSFLTSSQSGQSKWLKSGSSTVTPYKEATVSAIQSGFERLLSKPRDHWLCSDSQSISITEPVRDPGLEEGKWLIHSPMVPASSAGEVIEVEEI